MAPWTPLRLSELYATLGLFMAYCVNIPFSLRRVHKDENLAVVAVAGPLSNSNRSFFFDDTALRDPRAKEIAHNIRECTSRFHVARCPES